MRTASYIFTYLLLLTISISQVFGQQGYDFLRLPAAPSLAALGGHGVSQTDELLAIYHNPALSDTSAPGNYAFLWNPYFADVHRLAAAFQFKTDRLGKFHAGFVSNQFGDFDGNDASGNPTGTFTARDYVVFLGKSHTVGPFTLGANLKFASIVMPTVKQSALMLDVGGLYRHPEQQLNIGFAVRNGGIRMGDLTAAGSLPLMVAIGTTFKPAYMPIRFSVTAFNIGDNDAAFVPDNRGQLNVVNKTLRQLTLGGAFLLGENLEILAGYNARRRQELSIASGAYGAGLSMGFLLRIRQFELRYSRMGFHAAGGTSFISISGTTKTFKNLFD